MDPLLVHLESAVYNWCQVPPPYAPGVRLVDLWVRGFGTATPFFPDGADALVSSIYQDYGFTNCSQAHRLNGNYFAPNGIVYFGQLYDFLRPCMPLFAPPSNL